MPIALVEPIGRAIVIVHPAGAMPAAEWTANIEKMRGLAEARPEIRVIVWADGVIDSPQRREIIDLIKNRPTGATRKPVRVVMFTSNILTRGVMQALGWMGVNVGSYSQQNFLRDIAAEGYSAAEGIELQAGIAAMERRIKASVAGVAVGARRG